MTFTIDMIYDKATKNKYVFVPQDPEDDRIPSLYIDKTAFEGKPFTIEVTITES